MMNQWFKFYGGEYLSDPKMLALTASERSCLLTLFCYASMSEKDGEIKHLTEDTLMAQSGINPVDAEWKKTKGVLSKFEKLKIVTASNGVIVISNWTKRQGSFLTNAERQARYRDRHSNDGVTEERNESNARREENRIDKKREEKMGVGYLVKIPKADIQEFMLRFVVTEKEIASKAEDLKLYCERKGRVYRNYKAFLLNALKRDFKERDHRAEAVAAAQRAEREEPVTEEVRQRNREILKKVRSNIGKSL